MRVYKRAELPLPLTAVLVETCQYRLLLSRDSMGEENGSKLLLLLSKVPVGAEKDGNLLLWADCHLY